MSFFEFGLRDHSKDHAVAASMSITMTNPATALHHYQGRNCARLGRECENEDLSPVGKG